MKYAAEHAAYGTSKPAKTKRKWLKLRMSRPTVLCYGQTDMQFYGLFIAVVLCQKFLL